MPRLSMWRGGRLGGDAVVRIGRVAMVAPVMGTGYEMEGKEGGGKSLLLEGNFFT